MLRRIIIRPANGSRFDSLKSNFVLTLEANNSLNILLAFIDSSLVTLWSALKPQKLNTIFSSNAKIVYSPSRLGIHSKC